MVNIEQFVAAHPLLIAAIAYIGYAIIETAPQPGDPRPFGQKVYQWFYDVTHLVANKYVERHPNVAIKPEEPKQ